MLKMYQRSRNSGQSHEFWDENWRTTAVISEQLAQAAIICEAQPFFPQLAAWVRRDRLFLEGGCGPSHWVKYFHDRGHRVLGVDFARATIQAVKQVDPTLPVVVGDVTALPLSDESVHAYYSGGVVEHFERGPQRALQEARRVLATDGRFFCSVPEESWLRSRVLYRGADPRAVVERNGFAVRRVEDTQDEPAPAETAFFQYVFSEREFVDRLRAASFEVIETFPMSFVVGLYEVPRFEAAYAAALRNVQRARRAFRGTDPAAPSPLTRSVAAPRPSGRSSSWLKRLAVYEDASVPVLGPAVRRAGAFVANMRMYVARPV